MKFFCLKSVLIRHNSFYIFKFNKEGGTYEENIKED